MSSTVLLLSIHPKYAEKIFRSGHKTAELRRTRPRVKAGDWLFVYVSSPVKALVGVCEVTHVVSGSPSHLSEQVLTISGVTQEQFNDYYDGASQGFAIVFKNAQHLLMPLELACLRQEWQNFTPPQTYRYLSSEEVQLIRFMLEEQTGECLAGTRMFREDKTLFSSVDVTQDACLT